MVWTTGETKNQYALNQKFALKMNKKQGETGLQKMFLRVPKAVIHCAP